MAKLSTEDLLDAFKELTLLELSEFVKALRRPSTSPQLPPSPLPLPAPPVVPPPRPPRSSRNSTSSSRVPARRRSASSRSSARSSRAWASRRPRTSSTALPSRCSRRSPRRLPRRPRPSSRPLARRLPSSSFNTHVGGADNASLWGRSGKQIGPTVIFAVGAGRGRDVTSDKCPRTAVVSYSDSSHRREACGGSI